MLLPAYAMYYVSDFTEQLQNVTMKSKVIFVSFIKVLVGFKN